MVYPRVLHGCEPLQGLVRTPVLVVVAVEDELDVLEELRSVVHEIVDAVVHLAAGSVGTVVFVRAGPRQDEGRLVGTVEGRVQDEVADGAMAHTVPHGECVYSNRKHQILLSNAINTTNYLTFYYDEYIGEHFHPSTHCRNYPISEYLLSD